MILKSHEPRSSLFSPILRRMPFPRSEFLGHSVMRLQNPKHEQNEGHVPSLTRLLFQKRVNFLYRRIKEKRILRNETIFPLRSFKAKSLTDFSPTVIEPLSTRSNEVINLRLYFFPHLWARPEQWLSHGAR